MPVQVVVLEKGRFTPAAELSLKEREAGKDMYEMGTLLTTTDAGENEWPAPRKVSESCHDGIFLSRGC